MSTSYKDKILTYLKAPQSYEEGLQLYCQHGKNETLKKIFTISGATSYNHQKLIATLQQELGDYQPKADPSAQAKQKKQVLPKKRSSANGYAVDPKHPELIALYRERSLLRNRLPLLPNEKDRKDSAFAILDLTDKIETILFFGFSQARPRSLSNDRAILLKNYQQNQKYFSRYKDRPDKAAEIARRREENEQIKKLLDQAG